MPVAAAYSASVARLASLSTARREVGPAGLDGQPVRQPVPQQAQQRHVPPVQVGRHPDDTGRQVDEAGRRDTDAGQDPARSHGVPHHLPDEPDHFVDGVVEAGGYVERGADGGPDLSGKVECDGGQVVDVQLQPDPDDTFADHLDALPGAADPTGPGGFVAAGKPSPGQLGDDARHGGLGEGGVDGEAGPGAGTGA